MRRPYVRAKRAPEPWLDGDWVAAEPSHKSLAFGRTLQYKSCSTAGVAQG